MVVNEIDQQILSTAHDIEEYVNVIKSQPDDFAHKHLHLMQQSIETAKKALDSYVVKDASYELHFNTYYSRLDEAIKFLVQKGQEENEKAIADKSHIEKANELVVAIDAIKYLVALLRDVQEERPINVVKAENDELDFKIENSTGSTFNEKKQ